MGDVELTRTDDACGVRLAVGEHTWEVTFRTAGELGGHVQRTGPGDPIDRDLTTEVEPQSGIMARP
jgi:hypothetical protein